MQDHLIAFTTHPPPVFAPKGHPGPPRFPFEAGQVNIHSVSALAVEAVSIEKGVERPIRVAVSLSNSAGIYQVDELLKRKLSNSTLEPYVEVVATIAGESERRLIGSYKL